MSTAVADVKQEGEDEANDQVERAGEFGLAHDIAEPSALDHRVHARIVSPVPTRALVSRRHDEQEIIHRGRQRIGDVALAVQDRVREIAEDYHLSTKTVDTYRARLLKKLNLRNNADLSRFAIRNGLVEV